jgi:hypothetical protein
MTAGRCVERGPAGVHTRLLLDCTLRKISKWLRAVGVDTTFFGDSGKDFDPIFDMARMEARVIVTQNRRMVMRKGCPEHFLCLAQEQFDCFQVSREPSHLTTLDHFASNRLLYVILVSSLILLYSIHDAYHATVFSVEYGSITLLTNYNTYSYLCHKWCLCNVS